jgi:hypothetical protein
MQPHQRQNNFAVVMTPHQKVVLSKKNLLYGVSRII